MGLIVSNYRTELLAQHKNDFNKLTGAAANLWKDIQNIGVSSDMASLNAAFKNGQAFFNHLIDLFNLGKALAKTDLLLLQVSIVDFMMVQFSGPKDYVQLAAITKNGVIDKVTDPIMGGGETFVNLPIGVLGHISLKMHPHLVTNISPNASGTSVYYTINLHTTVTLPFIKDMTFDINPTTTYYGLIAGKQYYLKGNDVPIYTPMGQYGSTSLPGKL